MPRPPSPAEATPSSLWLQCAAIAFVLSVLGLSVVATVGGRRFLSALVNVIPGEDLTAHAVLYGCAAFLCGAAFGDPAQPRRTWRNAGWVGVLSVVEESTQLLIPGRTFSGGDLLANGVGIGLGTLLAIRLHSRTRKPGAPAKLG